LLYIVKTTHQAGLQPEAVSMKLTIFSKKSIDRLTEISSISAPTIYPSDCKESSLQEFAEVKAVLSDNNIAFFKSHRLAEQRAVIDK